MKTKLLILSIILGLAACTKYDEGPKISFRNAEKLILGYWDVSKYEVNSIDSTNYYLEHKSCVIHIYVDMHEHYFNLEKCKDATYVVGMAGSWALTKENNSLSFNASYQENYWLIFDTKLSIKRLTKNELILETEMNQNHYRLELINK